MTQTVKTIDQLLAELPDNTTRLIHPADVRDVVVSCFPYIMGTVPGPDNDRIDSAGIGAFFDFGSHWLHLSTGDLYYCTDGQPTAAVWVKINGGSSTTVTGTYPVVVTNPVAGTYNVAWAPPYPTAPSTIPGITQWFEQDGSLQDIPGGSPVSNGGPVGRWNTQAGGGSPFDYFFSTSWRPTFILNDYAGINAVSFAPINELFTSANDFGATALTVFMVVNFSSSGNSNTYLFGDNAGDSWMKMQSGGPRWLTTVGGGMAYQDHAGSLDSVHVCARVIDTTASTVADAFAGWFDGVPETLVTGGTVPSQLNHPDEVIYLGGDSGGGDATVKVYAVLWWPFRLTDAQIDGVNSYLVQKYIPGVPPASVQSVGALLPLYVVGSPAYPIIGINIFTGSAPGAVPSAIGSLPGSFLDNTGRWSTVPPPTVPFQWTSVINTFGAQSIPGSGQVAIDWNDGGGGTVLYDDALAWNPSFPTRFTAQVGGFYAFHAKLHFLTDGAAVYRLNGQLLVNGGASQVGLDCQQLIPTFGTGTFVSFEFSSPTFTLNAGDYVELWFGSTFAFTLHHTEAQFQQQYP